MAEAPPVRKFMFDRTFDPSAAHYRAPERKPVTLKPEQYDALKKESFDAGYAEGRKAGADAQGQQLIALFTRIDERIGHMIDSMAELRVRQDADMRQLAIAMTRKLLPNFTAKYGIEEIQATLNDAIAEMVHEPRMVVRVHADQFDVIQGKIAEITQQKAYSGKVVVLSDPEIAAGDCRVEWADGGIERKTEATLNTMAGLVAPETVTS